MEYEQTNQIIRGEPESRVSARMFGEFFDNGNWFGKFGDLTSAIFAEAIGTFILVFVILIIGNTKRKISVLAPILIGITITLLILCLAPITQGGFNPARDFGPRLVAYFGGWDKAAFPVIEYSFFLVYILAPFIGGVLATMCYWLYKKISNTK